LFHEFNLAKARQVFHVLVPLGPVRTDLNMRKLRDVLLQLMDGYDLTTVALNRFFSLTIGLLNLVVKFSYVMSLLISLQEIGAQMSQSSLNFDKNQFGLAPSYMNIKKCKTCF
jgi:hypothetical protein